MENNELLQAIGQMISESNRKMTEDMLSIMDDKLKPINDRLTKIEIALENDISKKLDILFDGHQLDSEKLSKIDPIEETIEETKSNVDVIFEVVQEHSREIKELKLAN